MKLRIAGLTCAFALAAIVLNSAAVNAHARGFGGSRGGGFSRESPAAGGSFSSRAGAGEGRARNSESGRGRDSSEAQSSRQQYGSQAQSSRQQEANGLQKNRDQEANSLQSSREQTAQSMQSSAQHYASPYYGGAVYPNWDAGVGMAAAATGAAVGTMAGAAAASAMAPHPSSGAQYAPAPPCSAPVTVPLGGTNYVKCGSTWYTQAYGPAGPEYVQVQPPAAH